MFTLREVQGRDRIFKVSRYLVTSNHLILVGDFNFIHNSSVDKIGGSYSREHVGSKEFKYIQEQLSW